MPGWPPGLHGELDYMERHGRKRSRPAELRPGTCRIITARMDYLTPCCRQQTQRCLQTPERGYIARYALGRDYHKLCASGCRSWPTGSRRGSAAHSYRVFTDSAPVMEKPLAEAAGLGWIGKHTNLINRQRRVLLSARRDLHRPAARNGHTSQQSLRQLPGLPGDLPDPGHHRTLYAGCAPLHQLLHDRDTRPDPR